MKYAPVLLPTPTTPTQSRKRSRKARDRTGPGEGNDATKPKRSRQRRVSDDFHTTKPVTRRAAQDLEDVAPSDVSTVSTSLPVSQSAISVPKETRYAAQQCAANMPGCQTLTTPPRGSSVHTNLPCTVPSSNTLSGAAHIHPPYIDQEQATFSDDLFEDDDDLFSSIGLSTNTLEAQSTHNTWSHRGNSQDATTPTNCGSSSLTIDGDKVSSPTTSGLEDGFGSPPYKSNETSNANNLPVFNKGSLDAVDAVHTPSNTTQGPTAKFKSPVTPETATIIRKNVPGVTNRKPIVRSPFPDPVRDRSPIIGLSSNLVLRTCFRIGEAINQAGKATRNGQNILFELYAQVLTSHRDAVKQHFVFADLFHERPPHLKGEYDAIVWKPVELFNYDSGRFLSKAKICRCIGHIKRNESKEWVMAVLNIWEATWEDIEWVEGIVGS